MAREVTERPEVIEAGAALLVGTGRERIEREMSDLLADPDRLAGMSRPCFPYGRGDAAQAIARAIGAHADRLREEPS